MTGFQEAEFELLSDLLDLTGHNDPGGPADIDSCLSVSEATIASWSPQELAEVYRRHDIHIIPSAPEDPGFNIETCEKLCIDIYQMQDAHGRLAASATFSPG